MFRNDHQNTITNFQTPFFQPSNIATAGLACVFPQSVRSSSYHALLCRLSQDSRRIIHDANGIVVLKQTVAKKSCWTEPSKKKKWGYFAASGFLLTIMYIWYKYVYIECNCLSVRRQVCGATFSTIWACQGRSAALVKAVLDTNTSVPPGHQVKTTAICFGSPLSPLKQYLLMKTFIKF